MIDGTRVLAVVPARGGSKGVPGKNLRELAGRPLIDWTLDAAKESALVDRVIVSSEDAAILEHAAKWGDDVAFERPEELARDDTPGIEPVLHAISAIEGFGIVVLLQPTSPLRVAADIDECIRAMHEHGTTCCVSVSEVSKLPHWCFTLGDDARLVSAVDTPLPARRQDVPPHYGLNGAIYVADIAWLLRERSFMGDDTRAFVMPRERSIDIDVTLDFAICEAVMAQRE